MFQSVQNFSVVLNVDFAGNVFVDVLMFFTDEDIPNEFSDEFFVFLALIQIGDFRGPIDGCMPRGGFGGVFRNDIPVFDDFMVFFGIKKVCRYPLSFPVV